MSARPPVSWPDAGPERVEARLSIERDGTVVARSGKVEYGQGIRTGFAMIVAEELDVPLEHVRVELGETDRVPWDMGTFGSLSTATDGKALRRAAAHARDLLLERAARHFEVPVAELDTHDGSVHAADGRSVAYGELTATAPLTGLIPENARGRLNTQPAPDAPRRLDALAIVAGRARYPADVRLPGMLRGHVLHPSVPGSRLLSVDDSEARALPGVVQIVRDGDFVGVVAERDEQAQAGANALDVEWGAPEVPAGAPFESLLRSDEGIADALAGAAHRLDARYHVPHMAHAPIGPSAAVADVREDGADLYVATQRPFGLRDEVAAILGLRAEQVHVHPQTMGGMYGRGNMHDAPLDAVRLARAVGRPVLVQWTRTEEFRLSPHRPELDAEVAAALDADGTIAAWRYHEWTNPHTYGSAGAPASVIEMTSGRNAVPPYRLGCARIRLQVEPAPIRTGAFRSLAAAPNVFAIESFMDELAHAAGQDPLAFRLRHIDDPRLRRVLETAAERSGWEERPRGAGRGFGIACTIYHGTYVAEVAEVVVDEGGRVRLERVWCAVDAGRLVHPDGARNQIEGGVQQAASWTLLEELRRDGARVTTTSWRDYAIATAHDAPRAIDVVFTGDTPVPSTGVGEPGSVPTAAAIANAVFAACGARVRRLPLSPAAVAAAVKP